MYVDCMNCIRVNTYIHIHKHTCPGHSPGRSPGHTKVKYRLYWNVSVCMRMYIVCITIVFECISMYAYIYV